MSQNNQNLLYIKIDKRNQRSIGSPIDLWIERIESWVREPGNKGEPWVKKQGVKILKFLMKQNNLKQKDLVGVIGGKSTVSEILNGKRPMNLQHIRVLADKFHVEPATFV